MFLEYVALGILIFVALVLFYGIIAIHDIPYEIAVARNHPHQEMMHIAGWVSMFTVHAIWPFLWIWATLYNEEHGWGMGNSTAGDADGGPLGDRLKAIETRLANLETVEAAAQEPVEVSEVEVSEEGE